MAGLFSAKRTDRSTVIADIEAEVCRLGGRVVASFVQRRGVSGGKKGSAPGGVAAMSEPYSSRTLMSAGKVHEIAEACARTNAAAVVFSNELTDRQRTVLTRICGRPVFGRDDLTRCVPDRPSRPVRDAHEGEPL
ncbi:HflX-like GTP-binding protein [Nocardia aurantia]|uniref:HflX-like GTP-binding protein n=1 Tax=Nocardia aurantia TaxID=2585199 RepID=UPI0029E812A1|nr:hypothetical protein [Nocardia aurantia]